jgi:rubrerythrin
MFKGTGRLDGAATRSALISQLKGLAISELAADDSYAALYNITDSSEAQKVIEEIRSDEQNHLGRLMKLICELELDSYLENLNKGLEGKE